MYNLKKIKSSKIKGVEYYRWKDIEKIMSPVRFDLFQKWLIGQTVIKQGPYTWDVDNYLNEINNVSRF